MRSTSTTHRKANQAGASVPDRERRITPLLAMALDAGRRRCDDFEDGPAAREQMRRDVLDTPAVLLPDLLQALTLVRLRRSDLTTTPARKEPTP